MLLEVNGLTVTAQANLRESDYLLKITANNNAVLLHWFNGNDNVSFFGKANLNISLKNEITLIKY